MTAQREVIDRLFWDAIENVAGNAGRVTIDTGESAIRVKSPDITVLRTLTAGAFAFQEATTIFAGATSGVIVQDVPGVEILLVNPMQVELDQLKLRVADLEQEVKALKAAAQEEVIVLRTLSREQAKGEALDLFRRGQPLLYSDVARLLGIDLSTAVDICEELIAEGEVTASGNLRS